MEHFVNKSQTLFVRGKKKITASDIVKINKIVEELDNQIIEKKGCKNENKNIK